MKKHDRIIISLLTVWTFIHTYIMLFKTTELRDEYYCWREGEYPDGVAHYISIRELFYPFTYSSEYPDATYFNSTFYDYTEYFIYVAGAWMCFFLYKFLKGSK